MSASNLKFYVMMNSMLCLNFMLFVFYRHWVFLAFVKYTH